MKKIAPFLLVLAITTTILIPNSEARNILRDLGRGIKNVSRFIVTLPDKSTRWMGPVLGPIAADIISQNLAVNRHVGQLFTNAHRINQTVTNIDEQKKYLNQVQKNLRDQSAELRSQAQEIRNTKNRLEQDLLSRNITLREYEDKVISLENVADAYDRTADRFDRTAENIKPDNLIRMVTRNAWNQTVRQIRNEVKYSVKNELDRYVNPAVISSLIGGDDKSLDQIIEILASGNIASVLGQNDSKIDGDELRNRVKDRIKNVLETNKEALKNDWRGEINKVIKEEIRKLEEEKKKLAELEKENEEKEKDEQTSSDNDGGSKNSKPDDSDSRCPPGYTFCARCGISCIQKNCGDIPNAHYSYESYCICGSAGSINENPEDPNKVCKYPSEHSSCPGCVYACVHSSEECPPPNI